MYMRPSQNEETFADRTILIGRRSATVPSRREPFPPRVSAAVSHMELESLSDSMDRPPRISSDGFYDTLSINVQVNKDPSETTSSLNLNGDLLTIKIPSPRVDVQSSAVEYNNRKRRISSSSSSRRTSSSSSDCSQSKQSRRTTKAFNNFLRLFNNPDSFPDAIVKCGDTEIPVHKCILSVRSPVFEALFKSQMKEANDGIVNIVDIEPDVLEAMLKCVYSGKTDHVTYALAEDLLFAADKYQIDYLKSACLKKLKMSMTPNNILRILVLGELHDESLKACAITYITRLSDFSKVENTEEWKQLRMERSKLAMEVLLAVVKNMPKDNSCSGVRIDTVTTDQF